MVFGGVGCWNFGAPLLGRERGDTAFVKMCERVCWGRVAQDWVE
jgi:hypothetical protein